MFKITLWNCWFSWYKRFFEHYGGGWKQGNDCLEHCEGGSKQGQNIICSILRLKTGLKFSEKKPRRTWGWKRGSLLCTNLVKTALIYSIVTIYLGLRPKMILLIDITKLMHQRYFNSLRNTKFRLFFIQSREISSTFWHVFVSYLPHN